MKKRDTGRKNEEKSENIAWFTLKKQLGTAVPSCFFKFLFFIWSSITSSHNSNQNRPLFKSTEKPNGKRQILSHQRDAKRLKIAEEDDKIVEKQLAAAVPSCFPKATLLCIDFQKNAKQLPIRAGSCFYGVRGVEKVPKLEIIVVKRWVDCEDIQRTDSEILLLAAAGSTIFKICSRCVFTVYSSLDDNPF